jgi:hypothetical protein
MPSDGQSGGLLTTLAVYFSLYPFQPGGSLNMLYARLDESAGVLKARISLALFVFITASLL